MGLDGIAEWYEALFRLFSLVNKTTPHNSFLAKSAARSHYPANCFSGRSAAACRNQFNLLTNRLSSVLSAGPPNQPLMTPRPKKKRPSAGPGPSTSSDTPLQPQQYQFAPINESSIPSPFQSVSLGPGETSEKGGKKRGRPSKAERELREAEAAARGEVYQPTKRKKQTPRPSAEGVGVEGLGEGETTPGSKKKSKKQKTAQVAPMAPPMVMAIPGETGRQSTSISGDQMQIDTPERPIKSTIPETQTSDFPATESLLSGMHEHAALSEPTTATLPPRSEATQSSVTLQQGSAIDVQPGPGYLSASHE